MDDVALEVNRPRRAADRLEPGLQFRLGYYPSGGVGLILLILIILAVTGRL